MKTYKCASIDLYNDWILGSWEEGCGWDAPKPYAEWTLHEIYLECTEQGMGEGTIGEIEGMREELYIDGILLAEFWYAEDGVWWAKDHHIHVKVNAS